MNYKYKVIAIGVFMILFTIVSMLFNQVLAQETSNTLSYFASTTQVELILFAFLIFTPIIIWIGIIQIRKKSSALKEALQLIQEKDRVLHAHALNPDKSQTNDVAAIHKELNSKKKLLDKNLLDAQRFQQYILPKANDWEQDFLDNLVIFHPRSEVGGDFYWYLKCGRSTSYVAVVDCTGYGVSGAFLSMLGYNLLSKIVKEKRVNEPQQIIEQLHRELHQCISLGDGEDSYGMEIGLCRLEWVGEDKIYLTFSGAKSRLLYFNQIDFLEIQGNRKGIGAWTTDPNKEYHQQTILLPANSKIYMFTDGLIDHPNPQRQRFGLSRLRNLIQKNVNLPLKEQQTILNDAIQNHSQGTAQRDDITLIGLELKPKYKISYSSSNSNGHTDGDNLPIQDVTFNFFDYHARISQSQVILSYKGPLTDLLISQFSRDIRSKVMNNTRIGKKVFAIFMELAQNALFYSKEVNHFGNNDPVGTLVILNTENYYKILTGNLIYVDSVETIREKCELINSFDREELRDYKRRLRQAPREGESRGAGIGMIQAALTASSPVDYTIREVTDDHAFFVISVKVDKKKLTGK